MRRVGGLDRSFNVGGARGVVIPQQQCANCQGSSGSQLNEGQATASSPDYVFALGRVEARFPSLALEKEFAQVTGRSSTAGLTDGQALQSVLTDRTNRYLARNLCWVFTVQGLETYILVPNDPVDFELLMGTIRPQARPTDVDAVIGIRGPLAPPAACNGLTVPIVMFDQIYSFDTATLVQAIERPETIEEEQFGPAAEELFSRIIQVTDNAGARDEDRALNYLAVRYDRIYALAAESYGRNLSLTAVDVRPSRLSGVRKVVDVIFTFTNRNTDVNEQYFVRVDVTEEFPFLVTKLSPYFER